MDFNKGIQDQIAEGVSETSEGITTPSIPTNPQFHASQQGGAKMSAEKDDLVHNMMHSSEKYPLQTSPKVLRKVSQDENELAWEKSPPPFEAPKLKPRSRLKSYPVKLNESLQALMQKYLIQTGKNPTYGLKTTNEFKDWIKKTVTLGIGDKVSLLEQCNEFDALIKRCVIGYTLFSGKSQREIAKEITSRLKVPISFDAVQTFTIKILIPREYATRFPSRTKNLEPSRLEIAPTLISPTFQKMINDYTNESRKKPIIGIRITNLFKKFIQNNKSISQKVKNELLKECESLQKNLRDIIIFEIRKSKKSLKAIAKKFSRETGLKISYNVIRTLAKEILTDQEFKDRFPSTGFVDEESKLKAMGLIVLTKKTQKEIAELLRKYGKSISRDTVGHIGREFLPPRLYFKRFRSFPQPDEKVENSMEEVEMRSSVDSKRKENIGTHKQKKFKGQTGKGDIYWSEGKLRKFFEDYYNEKGLLANKGLKLTNGFFNWIMENKRISNQIKRNAFRYIELFERKVKKFVKALIVFSNKSYSEIARDFSKTFGISVSRSGFFLFAKKFLTEKQRDQRFETPGTDETIKNLIIVLLIFTNKSAPQITEEVKRVSRVDISGEIVRKVARKTFDSYKSYKRRFPSAETYPEEVKIHIKELILNSNYTIGEIIAEIKDKFHFEAKRTTIQNIAKELLSPNYRRKRFPMEFFSLLGLIVHNFIEKVLISFMRDKGVKVVKEQKLPYSHGDSIPDNIITVNKKLAIDLPDKIKYIALDYSLDTSQGNFERKCNKSYQNKETQFWFIPLAYKSRATDYQIPSVPFQENIKVVPLVKFLNFFKGNKNYRNTLIKFLNLAFEIKRTRKDLKLLEEFGRNLITKVKLITDFE